MTTEFSNRCKQRGQAARASLVRLLAALWLTAGGWVHAAEPVPTVALKVVDPLATIYDEKGFLEITTTSTARRSFEEVKDLGTIRLVGPRNGTCSANVVALLSAPQAIRAEISPLRSPNGDIPAKAVQIRYARNPGIDKDVHLFTRGHPCAAFAEAYHYRSFCDLLLPGAPDDACLVPVWVTVSIPSDTRPGKYTGTLTVAGRQVPVELIVADWVCPQPADFACYVGLLESPDTVAAYYNVAPWSERHLDLVGRSFDLMKQLGSRSLCVPVLRQTHLGNQSGMVTFVKSGDGWQVDLTAARKYLELFRQHVGTPDNVVLYVWDPPQSGRRDVPGATFAVSQTADGREAELRVPIWGEPGSEAVGKPLMDGFGALVEELGWKKEVVRLGLAGDQRPSSSVVEFFRSIAPWATWAIFTHGNGDPDQARGRFVLDGMEVGLYETVQAPFTGWDAYKDVVGRRGGVLGGWDRDNMRVSSAREFLSEYVPLSQWRSLPEATLADAASVDMNRRNFSCRGITRLGADFWEVPTLTDERGWNFVGRSLFMRFNSTMWAVIYRPYSPKALLSPGPDGPVATARFEMLREGLQECEARVAIEKAIAAGKAPADVEKRWRELLADRVRTRYKDGKWGDLPNNDPVPEREVYWRLWGTAANWQELTAQLFAAAGEAQRIAGP